MKFSVLASGSKANCTFIEAGGTKVLVDCGLSVRETERRLIGLGRDPGSIAAICLTHEHSDHLRAVGSFSRKHKIPVYSNALTRNFVADAFAVEVFRTGESFQIGALSIQSFSIVHDASDPVGFAFTSAGIKVAQATDLGRVTEIVRASLACSHALIIESNHDEDLLRACDYPWVLKQRILSSQGHLSNDTAGNLLRELTHSDLQQVVLAHLSENSNTQDLALNTVSTYLSSARTFGLCCGTVQSSTELFDLDYRPPNRLLLAQQRLT